MLLNLPLLISNPKYRYFTLTASTPSPTSERIPMSPTSLPACYTTSAGWRRGPWCGISHQAGCLWSWHDKGRGRGQVHGRDEDDGQTWVCGRGRWGGQSQERDCVDRDKWGQRAWFRGHGIGGEQGTRRRETARPGRWPRQRQRRWTRTGLWPWRRRKNPTQDLSKGGGEDTHASERAQITKRT